MRTEIRLRRFENCEPTAGTTEVNEATAAGGNRLVVAGAETEDAAELIVASTEALGRSSRLSFPITRAAARFSTSQASHAPDRRLPSAFTSRRQVWHER